MDLAEAQARIDAITWYHEFDFPNGLKARSKDHTQYHRPLWEFIRKNLDEIDFTQKSVLDLGCWDGYWSFYAEKRGARRVFATDDKSQNWAGSSGLLLAKEFLNSAVDTRLDVSIYNLDVLGQTFDIILCLGIYYHLHDPFYAFSQVRHRCGPDTLVAIQGNVTTGMRENTVQVDYSDHSLPIYLPTPGALTNVLLAAYLEPIKQVLLFPAHQDPSSDPELQKLPPGLNQSFTLCRPFSGTNKTHPYPPPFGLAAYDDRYRGDL